MHRILKNIPAGNVTEIYIKKIIRCSSIQVLRIQTEKLSVFHPYIHLRKSYDDINMNVAKWTSLKKN